MAAQVFGDPHRKVKLDSRFFYGEDRYLALGRVDGRVLTVVYTMRNDAIRIISARKANSREVKNMKTIRVTIDVHKPLPDSLGLVNKRLLDATTEEDIAKHKAIDDAEAMLDAAQFARRVRRRLGFSQAEFAMRIDVSLDTIRNWEQGKRSPTGAAKALLKVLDKAPEVALAALQ